MTHISNIKIKAVVGAADNFLAFTRSKEITQITHFQGHNSKPVQDIMAKLIIDLCIVVITIL